MVTQWGRCVCLGELQASNPVGQTRLACDQPSEVRIRQNRPLPTFHFRFLRELERSTRRLFLHCHWQESYLSINLNSVILYTGKADNLPSVRISEIERLHQYSVCPRINIHPFVQQTPRVCSVMVLRTKSPTHLKCSRMLTFRAASLMVKILERVVWSPKIRRWPSLSG